MLETIIVSRREKTCTCLFFFFFFLGGGGRGANNKAWCRPACASAQADQRLCYSLIGKYHIWTCYERNFHFLASLRS